MQIHTKRKRGRADLRDPVFENCLRDPSAAEKGFFSDSDGQSVDVARNGYGFAVGFVSYDDIGAVFLFDRKELFMIRKCLFAQTEILFRLKRLHFFQKLCGIKPVFVFDQHRSDFGRVLGKRNGTVKLIKGDFFRERKQLGKQAGFVFLDDPRKETVAEFFVAQA